jgi:integrase
MRSFEPWVWEVANQRVHGTTHELRGDRIHGDRLGEKVVWQMLREYAIKIGVPGSAPHDLRRTCAKLCRAAGGEMEQIQMLLGHRFRADDGAIPRNEAYLVHAPKDAIKLRMAV